MRTKPDSHYCEMCGDELLPPAIICEACEGAKAEVSAEARFMWDMLNAGEYPDALDYLLDQVGSRG